MKKLFAISLSLLFFVSLSFAVVGCKKAEEQKPEAAVETPAPVPEAAPAPEAAPEAVPEPEAAPAPDAPATN